MMDQLDSHLDNIAMADTNEKEVLAQLTNTNTKLTALTTAQYGHIDQILKARPSASASTSNPTNPSDGKNSVFQLRHALKNEWVIGTFCSTHGWGTSHNSPNCTKKGQGHIDTVTRANPSGPGINCNKDWNDFYSTWRGSKR